MFCSTQQFNCGQLWTTVDNCGQLWITVASGAAKGVGRSSPGELSHRRPGTHPTSEVAAHRRHLSGPPLGMDGVENL